jgi:tRNA 2-selenouridine synthase
MSEQINITELLEMANYLPVFDVRSPVEFNAGHIPSAFNLPLFTDDERALVGTRYKLSGKEDAIMLALSFVGPKLTEYIDKAKDFSSSKEVLIHCWRGGMRSSSMSWLLDTAGFKTYILEGGYRAYRRYIRKCFETKANIIILGGMTGSGKTEILEKLADTGEQVLNLEVLASHRGSVLGSVGMHPQPSNEQFENDVFYHWNKFDLSKPIWIEDESFQLGHVNIPQPLFVQMIDAPVINIQIVRKLRICRLVNEYAHFDAGIIRNCIIRLEKRIGSLNCNNILIALENKDFASAVAVLLDYYDKTYGYALSKRKNIYNINLPDDNPSRNALHIVNFYSNLK